jgi:hypothetical protein
MRREPATPFYLSTGGSLRGVRGSHTQWPGPLSLDDEPIRGSHFTSVLHILPLNSIMVAEFQWKVRKHKLFYTKCLWIIYFFQIFYFIGSSVIYLSLSKIPIWTHQRQSGLRNLTGIVPRLPGIYKKNLPGRELASLPNAHATQHI